MPTATFVVYSGPCVGGPYQDQNHVKTTARFYVTQRVNGGVVQGVYEYSPQDGVWVWQGPDPT